MTTQAWKIVIFSQTLLMQVAFATPYYEYKIINSYPHSTEHFTQGLELSEGIVYESIGHYGKSKLVKYSLDKGSILKEQKLSRRYFAEGLTILGNKIYQLTWKSGTLFVYDKKNLTPLAKLKIPGQGWGLTNNGQQLIYSDGSNQLHFISPIDGRHQKTLDITENDQPVKALNELEWIDNKIYANIWHSNDIVIIDPYSGKLIARVDLSKLLPKPLRNWNTGVLNGIAYHKQQKHLLVTGKNWPVLYEIRLKSKPIDRREPTISSTGEK